MGSWGQVQVEPGAEVPLGRGGAVCVAIGGRRILYFGGATREPTPLNDWWLLELSGPGSQGTWTRISPVVHLPNKRKLLPRSGASLTFVPAPGGGAGGSVLLFGGQDPVRGVIYDDLLRLDTASWELSEAPVEREPGAPPPPRPPARHSHVAGAYEQGGLILAGGAGLRGPLADVWLYDAAARRWRCLSAGLQEDECPEAREMAAGVMISEAGLLVHGGRAADGRVLSDIAIFDGRAGKWVLSHDTGVARCAHTASNAAVQAPPPAAPAAAEAAASSGAAPQAGAEGDGGAAAAAAPPGGGQPALGGGGTSGAAPPPVAANVLLYAGFTGEAVTGELLQLTFLRQHRSSGSHSLRAELRPVAAATEGAAPEPRFAHCAAALPGTGQVAIIGGVNQAEDLADVHVWSVADV